MRFKAVVFDLDGTLLDTLSDIASSCNEALATLGFPGHAVEDYRGFIGDGIRTLVARTLPEPKRDDETVTRCLALAKDAYGRRWNELTQPYPGIVELLDELSQRGIILAVLSNKPDDLTKSCIAQFFPAYNFAAVLGEQPGVPAKPNPSGALIICGTLSLRPSEILYLGDSAVDMETAHASGMFAVGALWGFRTQEELETSGAQVIVSHPSEVLDILG